MAENQHGKDVAKDGSTAEQLSPQPEKVAKVKFTSKQWMTLITLAFGNFCNGALIALQAPFFPAEAEKKGSTATEYGFIFGLFSLSVFITAPIVGKLVSYISPKYLLNVGILTMGITCIAFGSLDFIGDSKTFVALAFVVRTVEGAGSATMRTASFTIVAAQFPEGQGTTFAILQTSAGVGTIIGPTVGGALYDLGGYGLPFYAVGSIILTDALVIFFVLPHLEIKKSPDKGNFLKFWLHPHTIMYSLSVFTCYNYFEFNAATLEPHLRQFHLSGFFLGSVFALAGVVYAFASPFFGWLIDKTNKNQHINLLGSFIVVISILLIGPAPFLNLKPKLGLIIAALALMGFALGAKFGSVFTGTLESTMIRGFPADLSTYGLVSSMIASSSSIGAFAGPSLGGYLFDKFGFRNASMVLLIMETALITMLILSILKRQFGATTSLSLAAEPATPMKNGHIFTGKYSTNESEKRNSN